MKRRLIVVAAPLAAIFATLLILFGLGLLQESRAGTPHNDGGRASYVGD